ncbi:hypothetical protein SDC9_75014 [bioreactor metagenome]|uniref:Uncharacterized protein n=1 Tax=bioreactor metagenome TaxID=1076179 RepID=A0A644YKH6_9ZZZZ
MKRMLFTLLAVIMLFGTNTAASASSTELANVDSRSTSQEHVIQSAT